LERLLVETNAAVACTSSLLTSLLAGRIERPNITSQELAGGPSITPAEADIEQQRLTYRLSKAAQILQKKRTRTH
jgi:hypothetical protein